jgi:ferredoxin
MNNHPKRRFPFLSSTFLFLQEARRTPGYSFWDWVHGMIYGKWTYLYIGIGVGEHPLSRRFAKAWKFINRLLPPRSSSQPSSSSNATTNDVANGYHGKVVPLDSATQLVTIHEEIRLTNLEKVIPYNRARDIILQNPDHIVALDCPCRSARPNPCLPLDVCLVVGEPFASFVREHHPLRSRWITQQEAVEIIRAEEARGHVHHAFFKDAMLGRFYAICNCCSCCCGAMQAHRNGTPMLASSGYVCEVDEELCIACGNCSEECPFGALTQGQISALVDVEKCMGCGICVSHCEQGALTLVRDPSKGEPLEILKLMEIHLPES